MRPWILGALLLPLVGCASITSAKMDQAVAAPAERQARGFIATSTLNDNYDSTPVSGQDPAAPASPARKMIYTGTYGVLVSNLSEATARFLARIEEAGGYLEVQTNASLTCRVPAGKFHELVAELPSYGRILTESVQAQDVTKKFLDLELRIDTAEGARTRLVALLEKAEKVEDILAIEKELRRLTEEIERLRGELRFLSRQIAYSTLQVIFSTHTPAPAVNPRPHSSRFHWINQVGVRRVLESF